jgi:signal transduction histidine kinase
MSPGDEPPPAARDAALILCHELHQPLTYLLGSLDRAYQALERRRRRGDAEQAALQVARCLADAHATAQHLLRVVAETHAWAHPQPERARRLDLRATVRAAAAMVQPGDDDDAPIVIDAVEPAWVLGIDTRLVYVFVALFAEALADDTSVLAHIRAAGGEVSVELHRGAPLATAEPRRATSYEELPAALGRSVVRHIVAAHGGRIERWPSAGAGIACRVTLPLLSAPVVSLCKE